MTLKETLLKAIGLLQEKGFETPRLDAELIMMHVTKRSQVQLMISGDEELPLVQQTVFDSLINMRLEGHPIAHIIGECGFWDMMLKVTPDTLIPRPDTEILVEKALTLLECNKLDTVLDLGTGSGAIILALKRSLPQIKAYAVDFSEAALQVASENAKKYNLEVNFYEGSWFNALDGVKLPESKSRGKGFDLIVSNPPYIRENDEHLSQGDVRFEPITALVSGKDGLSDIKHITKESHHFLRPNGYLMFEHGYDQGADVRAILEKHKFTRIETLRDYGGNERVTLGRLND